MTRISPLCVGSVRDSPLFSLAPLQNLLRLAWPSLVRLLHRYYVRGLGRIPTPPSRSYPASALRLPGPDCSRQPKRRPLALEIGFSCRWFPPLIEGGGAGLFDYVGSRPASRYRPIQVLPSPSDNRVSIHKQVFRSSIPQPIVPSVYASLTTSR